MTRRLILLLLLVPMMLFSAGGCPDSPPDDAAPGPDDAEFAQAKATITERYQALGIPQAAWMPAVYQYPQTVAAGTTVGDVSGQPVLAATEAGTLFWADLEPAARWPHPGVLMLVGDDGAVLATADTALAPGTVGEATWDVLDPDARDAFVVYDGPSTADIQLEPPATGAATLALGLPTPSVPSDAGTACVPKRVLIMIAGDPGSSSSDFTRDQNLDLASMRTWALSQGVGISDANIHTVTGSGGPVTKAQVDAAMQGANLQCCDEVIVYFTGHGWADRGFQLRQETVWADGPRASQVAQPGEYLTAADLAGYVGDQAPGTWLFIADACYAGGHGQSIVDQVNTANAGAGPDKNVKVLTASNATETAKGGTYVSPSGEVASGGLLTVALTGRTGEATGRASEPLPFDDLTGRIDEAFASRELTGRLFNTATLGRLLYSDVAGEVTEHPQFFETEQSASGCPCTESSDCEQPDDTTCQQAVCREGSCVLETAADGTTCGRQSTCRSSSCQGGSCVGVDAPDGTTCDDSDVCTTPDTCREGACMGVAKDCDDSNVCTTDSCDAAGDCSHEPADGPCDDGVACTLEDACAEGVCHPGTADDGVCAAKLTAGQAVCTTASCGGSGCSFAAKPPVDCWVGASLGVCNPSGGALPDGASGTVGVCVPLDPKEAKCASDADCAGIIGAVVAFQDTQVEGCMQAACVQGVCAVTPAALGTVCDVGDLCADYQCNGGGKCVWKGTKSPLPSGCACDVTQPDAGCDVLKAQFAGNPCASVSCVGDPGHCLVSPVVAECDPGAGVCWTGACASSFECKPRAFVGADLTSKPEVCDDGNGCTFDKCVGPGQPGANAAGCVNTCHKQGAVCDDDPSLVCVWVGDTCQCADPQTTCSCPTDTGPCQETACGPDGACVVTPAPDGTPCAPDEGDACNVGNCQGGSCSGAGSTTCDDGDDCTDDVCLPGSGGCVQVPAPACAPECTSDLDCGDGNPCTDDQCLDGSCATQPLTGAACDDGDACTVNDVCDAGTCWGTPLTSCCAAEQTYIFPPGGALLPELGGVPPLDPLPMYLDPTEFLLLHLPNGTVDLLWQMQAPVPLLPPDTYGLDLHFMGVTLAMFAPGVQGAGQNPHPPLQGATHQLAITFTDPAQGWVGQLWAWAPGANQWTLAQDGLPVQVQGDTLGAQFQVPGLDACWPFKALVQLRRDDGQGQDELVWKMLTAEGLDPNGPPLSPQ